MRKSEKESYHVIIDRIDSKFVNYYNIVILKNEFLIYLFFCVKFVNMIYMVIFLENLL
jgi:hypothetical protein